MIGSNWPFFWKSISADKESVKTTLEKEIIRLAKTDIDIDLELFFNLSEHIESLTNQMTEYELSRHVTRFFMNIQFDMQFDDLRVAKKIQTLKKLEDIR